MARQRAADVKDGEREVKWLPSEFRADRIQA